MFLFATDTVFFNGNLAFLHEAADGTLEGVLAELEGSFDIFRVGFVMVWKEASGGRKFRKNLVTIRCELLRDGIAQAELKSSVFVTHGNTRVYGSADAYVRLERLVR